MFDIGFSEMMVIGVVALIVLGPEKLPRVARTVGALLGRMQRYVSDVKADINREMDLADLKKVQNDVKDAASSFESTMRDMSSTIQGQVNDLNTTVENTFSADALTKAEGDIAAQTTPVEIPPPDMVSTDAYSQGEPVPREVTSEPPSVVAAVYNQDTR